MNGTVQPDAAAPRVQVTRSVAAGVIVGLLTAWLTAALEHWARGVADAWPAAFGFLLSEGVWNSLPALAGSITTILVSDTPKQAARSLGRALDVFAPDLAKKLRQLQDARGLMPDAVPGPVTLTEVVDRAKATGGPGL